MMKKRLLSVLLAFVFVFVVSMPALAQPNNIDIIQTSPDNAMSATQYGTDLDIDITQTANDATNGENDLTITQGDFAADGDDLVTNYEQTSFSYYNYADITQNGSSNDLTGEQNADGDNYLEVTQDGFSSEIDILQDAVAVLEDNYAEVEQDADNADINVDQDAGTYNDLYILQMGDNATLDIDQYSNNAFTDAEVYQITAWSTIDLDQYADGYNNAYIDTDVGTNAKITVNQHGLGATAAGGYNNVSIQQGGSSSDSVINVEQSAGGNNDFINNFQTINSKGCSVRLSQTAFVNNYAEIFELEDPGASPSLLTNANALGVPGGIADAATQISAAGSNLLEWTATGGANTLGLYQSAHLDNSAYVTQTGGGNTLGVYQTATAPGSSNLLTAIQDGGDTAKVSQTAVTGNEATVTQN